MVRNCYYRALNFIAGLLWFGLIFTNFAHAQTNAPDRIKILTSLHPILLEEFSRGFRSQYQKQFKKEVIVEWLDQGSPQRNLRFVVQLKAAKAKTQPIDVVWGGGVDIFREMQRLEVLEALKLNQSITESLSKLAVPAEDLRAKDSTWVASALSSFGILVNWAALKEKTSDIGTGARELSLQSLTLPGFKNLILVMDPRQSSTFSAVCASIIRSQGWDAGMQLIESFFVHSRTIAKRDLGAVGSVSRGQIGATFAVDYHAFNLTLNSNRPELEFSSVSTVKDLAVDPIAIIKGAENQIAAQRFVQYVLSREGQGLLQLAKGTPNGPVQANLGRIAVRSEIARAKPAQLSNHLNPFSAPKVPSPELTPTMDVPSELISTIIGKVYVDQHQNWLRIEDQNPPRGASSRRDVWLGVAFLPKAVEMPKFMEKWKQEKQRVKQIETIEKNMQTYFAKRLKPVSE